MWVYHGDPQKLAAPDPEASPELFEFVARRYGLQGVSPRDLGGSFNLNVLLDGYVVRVYGPWVSDARLQVLQDLRRTLRARGVPIPEVRPALDGSPWCRFGDTVLEVERYVSGGPMDSFERLCAGMRALGRLHASMADLEVAVPPPIANHLPQGLALDATIAVKALVASWPPTAEEARLADAAEDLARRLPVIDLPDQAVHGDFWDNNVLFAGAEVAAVLDFDFAGVRPRVDDLALPLAYALEVRGAGFASLGALVECYDADAMPRLSADERRALPFAMARMALCFLQYLTIPADAAQTRRLRREFRQRRGPACAWWRDALAAGTVHENLFT